MKQRIFFKLIAPVMAALCIIAFPQTAKSQTEKAPEKPREIIYQQDDGMLRSTDGGRTWKLVHSKQKAAKQAAQDAKNRPAKTVIFTSGVNSYRSEDGGRTWEKENQTAARKSAQSENPAAKAKTLITFLPQPVGNEGQARIKMTEAGEVSLVIYDGQGQKVTQPIDSYMSEGEFTLPLDFSMLSSGSYTYTLIVGGAVQSGSLIVVK